MFDLHAQTLLLAVAGSRAYGLSRPDSDVDVKGVAVAPLAVSLSVFDSFQQADKPSQMEVFRASMTPEEQEIAKSTKLEGTVYGLRKFAKLAADCNPHVLDVLFCRDEELRVVTPLGRKLREHRDLFLSRRARHSFGSYASSQLKRIRGHRSWLLDPPTHAPTREEFGLPERTLIPADQLGAVRAAIQKQMDRWELDLSALDTSQISAIRARIADVLAEQSVTSDLRWKGAARAIGLDENFVHLLDRERRYSTARSQYRHYERWKKERNEARASLEAEHGYDTKHGAHLVRLLRMGVEVMETGNVRVWRGGHDADELRAIRDGAWSYEQLEEEAVSAEERLVELENSDACALPRRCDRAAVDALVLELSLAAAGLRG